MSRQPMMRYVVAGTDTGVGKTILSAALVDALGASYWKPVQAGLDDETDSQIVARLSGAAPARILPEAWRLRRPASPHLAARDEGVVIDAARLEPPDCAGPLIIETAGGVMTPLTDSVLTIDLLARWRFPIVLAARTMLGTINHSLLTLEVLRARDIPVLGVVFVGDEDIGAQASIVAFSRVRGLGRLPLLNPLTPDTLRAAFRARVSQAEFSS